MVDKTFILKHNSKSIRKKIDEAGINVCPCTHFYGAKWLDFSTVVNNGVHGVGYPFEDETPDENIARFVRECRNPVYCKNVDEFIDNILKFRNESKEDSKTD